MDESLMQELASGDGETEGADNSNHDNDNTNANTTTAAKTTCTVETTTHTYATAIVTPTRKSPLSSSSNAADRDTTVEQSPLHSDDMDNETQPLWGQPMRAMNVGTCTDSGTHTKTSDSKKGRIRAPGTGTGTGTGTRKKKKRRYYSKTKDQHKHHLISTSEDDDDKSDVDDGRSTLISSEGNEDEENQQASPLHPGSPDVWEEIRRNANVEREINDVGRKALNRLKLWAQNLKPLRRGRNNAHQVSFPINHGKREKIVDVEIYVLLLLRLFENQNNSKISSSMVPSSNEDYFYATLYWYFDERGMVPILTSRILNLFTLTFILVLSIFLLTFLDWHSLAQCRDEESCKALSEYVLWPKSIHSNCWLAIVSLYAIIFGVYWIWSFLSIFPTAWAAWGMHLFYQRHLGIEDHDLRSMEWHQVVDSWDRLLCVARLLAGDRKNSEEGASMHQSSHGMKIKQALKPLLNNIKGTDVNNLGDDAAGIMDLASSIGVQLHYVNTGVDLGLPIPSEWLLRPTVNPWAEALYEDGHDSGEQSQYRNVASNFNVDIRFCDDNSVNYTDSQQKDDSDTQERRDNEAGRDRDQPHGPPIVRRENAFNQDTAAAAYLNEQHNKTGVNDQELLTSHYIACRLMRRDNYLIAMFNEKVLDTSLPFPLPYLKTVSRDESAHWSLCGLKIGWKRFRLPFTRYLEWSIHVALLSRMFTNRFTLRKELTRNPRHLNRALRLIGLVQLLLAPFAFPFLFVYFAIKHIEDVQAGRSRGNYLGPQTWSPSALWKMREFNEVPHIFRRRMFAALPYASKYLRQFPSPVMAVIGKSVSFISGAFLSILLLMSLIDDAVPFHITLANRNLVWYIALLSGAVALGRSVTPDPEDSVHEPSETMAQLIPYTHYLPDHWRDKCGTVSVRQEFEKMYVYRLYLFGQELLSVLLVPLVMLVTLPAASRRILAFIEKNTVHVPELGAVCKYSLFEFSEFEEQDVNDEARGPGEDETKNLRDSSIVSNEDEYEDVEREYPYRAKTLHMAESKLQKSVLSFAANYPRWNHIVHRDDWFTSPKDVETGNLHKSAYAASGCGSLLTRIEQQGAGEGEYRHSGRSSASPVSIPAPHDRETDRSTRLHSSVIGRSIVASQQLGTGIDEHSASIKHEASLIGAYISSRPLPRRRSERSRISQSMNFHQQNESPSRPLPPRPNHHHNVGRSVELTPIFYEGSSASQQGQAAPSGTSEGVHAGLSSSVGNAQRADPRAELYQGSRLSYGSFADEET